MMQSCNGAPAAFRVRRMVLRACAALMVLGGVTVGLRAGLAYAGVKAGSAGGASGVDRDINAVLIGVGIAFAACVVSALLSLLVEIADSLWQLRTREEPEPDHHGWPVRTLAKEQEVLQ